MLNIHHSIEWNSIVSAVVMQGGSWRSSARDENIADEWVLKEHMAASQSKWNDDILYVTDEREIIRSRLKSDRTMAACPRCEAGLTYDGTVAHDTAGKPVWLIGCVRCDRWLTLRSTPPSAA